MYNEQLEQLIDAALADGVLTEKEKQILFKKAQTFGVDLDEFEMVLDARLVKLQKEQQAAAPKSNKFGDVKKCPACGAIVQSYQGKCNECGYAFEGMSANLSSTILANELKKIDDKFSKLITNVSGWDEREKRRKVRRLEKQRDNEKIQYIISFPIPSTKSDLIEFIITMKSRAAEKTLNFLLREAYRTRYKECIEKVKLIFSSDSTFNGLIDEYDKNIKKFSIDKVKRFYYDIPKVVWFLLLALCMFFSIWWIINIKYINTKKSVKYELKKMEIVNALRIIDEKYHWNTHRKAAMKLQIYANDYIKDIFIDAKENKDFDFIVKLYMDVANGYAWWFDHLTVRGEMSKYLMEKVKELLENNDYKSAMELVDKTDVGRNSLYLYLIENSLYNDAENYYRTSYNSDYSQGLLAYYNFMKDIVNDMVKKGKKNEARKFINKKVVYFNDMSDYQKKNYPEYLPSNVKKKLYAIVDAN